MAKNVRAKLAAFKLELRKRPFAQRRALNRNVHTQIVSVAFDPLEFMATEAPSNK